MKLCFFPIAAEFSTIRPYKVSLPRAYHSNPVPVSLAKPSCLPTGGVTQRNFRGTCPCKVALPRAYHSNLSLCPLQTRPDC